MQKKLADASTDAAYGLLAAVQVGRLKDAGGAAPEMVSMIKRHNCDAALRGARVLQEVLGGNAVSDEYGIGRHVANLFVVQTYEGQSDIHSESWSRGVVLLDWPGEGGPTRAAVISRPDDADLGTPDRPDSGKGHHGLPGVFVGVSLERASGRVHRYSVCTGSGAPRPKLSLRAV